MNLEGLKEHNYTSDVITITEFNGLLNTYKSVVPTKLEELEEQRLQAIPRALSDRTDAYLTKSELQTLVDWKLGHGTFRPSLRKLVGSNAEETVEKCTREAFTTYKNGDQWDKALSMLAKGLRGVGPATASLLLNTYDGEKVPFFSDELFRWVMFAEGRGSGWDRKIKYSMAEYRDLFKGVEELRERLSKEGKGNVTSVEVEMVAYVLGRAQGDESKEKRKGSDEGGERTRKRKKR